MFCLTDGLRSLRCSRILPGAVLLGLLGSGLSSCSSGRAAKDAVKPEMAASPDPQPYQIVRRSGPELPTFDELVELVEEPDPEGPLGQKVKTLFSTPFVDNQAYKATGLPDIRSHPKLGPSLRISTWNLEKSEQMLEAADALRSEASFKAQMDDDLLDDRKDLAEALRQRRDLAASDVLLLQEMDIGHSRSDYLFAAEHLARRMGMNFVYAPQQLEIDPVYLKLDHIRFENGVIDEEAERLLGGDPERYRGVFGVAVLSRFPIKRAQSFQLKNQPYDWYEEEIKQRDFVEHGRKVGSDLLFRFKPTREVKVGGRGFTRVDLHVPQLPQQTLTIINIHLEIKAHPKDREKQLAEILGYLKEIRNPVVMAGDYNSSATDVSPTSLFRVAGRASTDPSNLVSAGLSAIDMTLTSHAKRAVNLYKNYRNPLAWDVPFILPNKVKGLFELVEDFRFEDGGAFDFRGDHDRSINGVDGLLSNSNQRHPLKGFQFTFAVPRPVGPFGRSRLDWMFVKGFANHPTDREGPYRMAPHFGETLKWLNLALEEPLSDHHPITTVLPLKEPDLD